jgi:GDP-mannose 6-dehydrogenase
MKVAIVGYGVVGQAYHKMFPDAVIYDEPKRKFTAVLENQHGEKSERLDAGNAEAGRALVNQCDIALVAVFTPLKEDGTLDISIVEEVIEWIDTPLILIKSALHPGTTDYLVKKTGKNIAVSVEFIGEGNYYVPPEYPDQNDPTKHQMLIIGGEQKTAEACAEILWSKMSPTVKIHVVSALEAEITKLVENSYGALKVTFINTLLSLAQKSGTSFLRVHQAWQSDPRTDSMHLRAVSFNRGWKSKCWDKDVPALVAYAQQVGAEDMAQLFQSVLDINKEHIDA